MIEIPLSRGKVALIDDEDADLICPHKWYAINSPANPVWYACRASYSGEKQKRLWMHRVILGVSAEVDHIDRDGLNNRRGNLRLATRAQNRANSRSKSQSGFRGVYGAGQRYRAQIRVDGTTYHLGIFEMPEDAAKAYDTAAIFYFGQFATLNYPRLA